MLNVDPEKKDDKFYRYKMPALMCKVEGKGNGIKTVIVNITDVANAIRRPAEYLMRSFSADLGVGLKQEDDRWVLTGDHVKQDPYKMQNKLYEFITKGVLCKHCRNPETVYLVDRSRVFMRCKACSKQSDTTLNDKTVQYILRKELEASGDINEQRSRDEKQEEKWSRYLRDSTSAAAAEDGLGQQEEDAARQRTNPVEELRKIVDADVAESVVVDKVFDLKQEYGMQEKDLPKVVFRTYFQDPTHACMTIRACSNVLRRFTAPEMNIIVIEEAEHFAHRHKESMFQKFPIFLWELLSRNVIQQCAILQWQESGKSKGLNKEVAAELRNICEPLVNYLKVSS